MPEKPTQPKWEYNASIDSVCEPMRSTGHRYTIASRIDPANGPLIAAAPEMLAILRELTFRQAQDYQLFQRAVAVCETLKDWPGGGDQ
jgi:hypothetical protein